MSYGEMLPPTVHVKHRVIQVDYVYSWYNFLLSWDPAGDTGADLSYGCHFLFLYF